MSRIVDLETFVEVVVQGSFTHAAEKLGVSKSYVSKQIASLEDHLGVRLLNRTTRKIATTDAGQAFFERARRILDDVEEAERSVMQLNTAPRGILKMSAPMSFGLQYVTPIVAKFMCDNPELSVELDFSDREVDVIDEGFDLVIRIGQLADSSFIARKIAPVRLVTCASQDYLKRRGTPRTPHDLSRHECQHYTYQSSPSAWRYESESGEVVHVAVSGRMKANNGIALLEASRLGIGISVLPDFIVNEDLAKGTLVEVLNDWTPGQRAIWALYPHNRHLSAKVRLFIDFLAENLNPVPWAIGPSSN